MSCTTSRFWGICSFFLISIVPIYGAGVEDEDIQALRDWISSKRLITIREMGGQLSISGDVHAEFQSADITKNGIAQRGERSGIPSRMYDVEFNLLIDYRTENTWLSGRIRFDNDAGIFTDLLGTGTSNRLKVDRAYWGYRLIDSDRHTMDFDIGRRGIMSAFFDSRIEFGSNFDGVNLKDSYAFDKAGDFYYQVAMFLINERKGQFAVAAELGLLNIGKTGFYTKYSLCDWETKKMKVLPERFYFVVSQVILGYKWIPLKFNKPIVFYLAGLYNHRAQRLPITQGKKLNWGGYIGFSLGALKVAGNWAFDFNYQVLQPQCVPDFDVQGVGIGSNSDINFYYRKEGNKLVPNLTPQAEGNVNYRGFELTLQYLITNNLNLWQSWRQSVTLDRDIGPFRKYRQYELDFIYSF